MPVVTERVRRDWEDEGMPVMGSSLDCSSEMVQVGVMRRSVRTRGADVLGVEVDVLEEVGSEGTVIVRGMSWGVLRDIVVGPGGLGVEVAVESVVEQARILKEVYCCIRLRL